jgi:hypothetical protein
MKEFIEKIIAEPEVIDKLPPITIISSTIAPNLPWQN